MKAGALEFGVNTILTNIATSFKLPIILDSYLVSNEAEYLVIYGFISKSLEQIIFRNGADSWKTLTLVSNFAWFLP